jgi:hypothetical protein
MLSGRFWWGFVATGYLAACAMSTGILPAGPDTYTVTETYAPLRGGATTAQQVALTEANRFCEDSGKRFLPMNMAEGSIPIQAAYWGPTKYTVTFRCLLPNDPELLRPNFQQAPNLVIEQRNR